MSNYPRRRIWEFKKFIQSTGALQPAPNWAAGAFKRLGVRLRQPISRKDMVDCFLRLHPNLTPYRDEFAAAYAELPEFHVDKAMWDWINAPEK